MLLLHTGASVGTKQGFSIIKYTLEWFAGQQKFHMDFHKQPDFVVIKNRRHCDDFTRIGACFGFQKWQHTN